MPLSLTPVELYTFKGAHDTNVGNLLAAALLLLLFGTGRKIPRPDVLPAMSGWLLAAWRHTQKKWRPLVKAARPREIVEIFRVTQRLAQGCQELVTEKGQTLFLKRPNFGFY